MIMAGFQHIYMYLSRATPFLSGDHVPLLSGREKIVKKKKRGGQDLSGDYWSQSDKDRILGSRTLLAFMSLI